MCLYVRLSGCPALLDQSIRYATLQRAECGESLLCTSYKPLRMSSTPSVDTSATWTVVLKHIAKRDAAAPRAVPTCTIGPSDHRRSCDTARGVRERKAAIGDE